MWADEFLGISLTTSMLVFFLMLVIMGLAVIALVVYIKNNTPTPVEP